MEAILNFGIHVVTSLQGLGTWLILPMKGISFLGTEEFFMFVLPVLYWCVDKRLGLLVAVILMFSASINEFLKLVFHGPRPYWYSNLVYGFASETSFSFPSGHSQHVITVGGIIAATLRRRWVWIAAIVLFILMGISRLYLGVHFPHDVLFGWAIGAIILILTIRFWDPAAAWLKTKSLGQQIMLAFLLSLVLLLAGLIPFEWLKLTGWQAPAAWAVFAGKAISLERILTTSGTFFGLMTGFALSNRQGGFGMKAVWWKYILRVLLGVAGVLTIRYGLKFIFPDGETALASALRYLRYALIGAWITGGAPWAFLRLKLAGLRA